VLNVDWAGFSVASAAIVLAPGPGSMFVAKTAAVGHRRAGFMAMLGMMTGDACLILLSLVGASAVFLAHPYLFNLVRLVGAGYLIFLGLQSLFSKQRQTPDAPQPHGLPFRQAASITLLNPKAVLFFMSFFPIFIRSAENGVVAEYAAMTLIFMIISASYLCSLVYASSKLSLLFQQNNLLKAAGRKLCGYVLIGFGVKAALSSG